MNRYQLYRTDRDELHRARGKIRYLVRDYNALQEKLLVVEESNVTLSEEVTNLRATIVSYYC